MKKTVKTGEVVIRFTFSEESFGDTAKDAMHDLPWHLRMLPRISRVVETINKMDKIKADAKSITLFGADGLKMGSMEIFVDPDRIVEVD